MSIKVMQTVGVRNAKLGLKADGSDIFWNTSAKLSLNSNSHHENRCSAKKQNSSCHLRFNWDEHSFLPSILCVQVDGL